MRRDGCQAAVRRRPMCAREAAAGLPPIRQRREWMGHPARRLLVSHPFAKGANGWGTWLFVSHPFAKSANGRGTRLFARKGFSFQAEGRAISH
jgi:hypothetical protein